MTRQQGTGGERNMRPRNNPISALAILTITALTLTGCGDGGDTDGFAVGASGNIEGTWNGVSCTQSEGSFGTTTYGKGSYASVSLRFTLNADGSYKWVTANTNSTAAQTVNCSGTYAFTPGTSKLKVQGSCTAGSLSFDDDHLYTVEQLTSSRLTISEVTGIKDIGTETCVFAR
jgi:hypothetical protein